MIDPTAVPPIADEELLARFIVHGNEVRADGTVRPQLFLPYQRVELSVNRHRDASIDENWSIGRQVSEQRGKVLLGRADIRASACRIAPLNVVPKPILPHNSNHAEVIGYPRARTSNFHWRPSSRRRSKARGNPCHPAAAREPRPERAGGLGSWSTRRRSVLPLQAIKLRQFAFDLDLVRMVVGERHVGVLVSIESS